ncbi:hypothetical protein VTJ04DRAFT_1486 [Mycothermus thermophilus]|uniref:uncharacterized protein n=1 Tax=Humicola insolens TaxID=85995 RepID=UPI003742B5FF
MDVVSQDLGKSKAHHILVLAMPLKKKIRLALRLDQTHLCILPNSCCLPPNDHLLVMPVHSKLLFAMECEANQRQHPLSTTTAPDR